jgi:hypothetical protein
MAKPIIVPANVKTFQDYTNLVLVDTINGAYDEINKIKKENDELKASIYTLFARISRLEQIERSKH